jgi:hypothetical protein
MVFGFTTIYAISAYHHWCCEFESWSGRGVQHYMYVIKFVSDLWQVGGFLRVTPVSSTNKTGRHDITEILLKVALNIIKQTNKQYKKIIVCLFNSYVFCFLFKKWSFKTGDLLKGAQLRWNFLSQDKKRVTFHYRWLLNRCDFMGRFDCTALNQQSWGCWTLEIYVNKYTYIYWFDCILPQNKLSGNT